MYCLRACFWKEDENATAEELTTVDLLVPLQQVLLNEAHVTLTAPERPLTCAIKNTTIRSPHYLTLIQSRDRTAFSIWPL